MYGLDYRRVIAAHSACSSVTDLLRYDNQKPVQILCQVHDNSISFHGDPIQLYNAAAAATALHITNYYISKLSLEYFTDHKEVKSLTVIK